jgi:transposase-like protein
VQRRKPLRAASELPDEVRERLDELFSRDALEEALAGVDPDRITGPGGLITELAGRVIEAALGAELTAHLGHPPGGRPAGPNVRNGSTPKTLQSDLGAVEIRTPRDRDGSFEPQLVGKGQTRMAGLDDRILDLYAGGLSTRDISAHLAELYGVAVGRDTISRVTAAVLEDVKAWQARPLERVYPIVYFDAMRVKVRKDRSVANRACYLALGVTCEGDREPLGIWWQDTEGAKFWLAVLSELQHRGVEDILIACVDGLTGFPEAIEAVFPATWTQTCIVHEIRASMRFVTYKDRKRVAAALKPVYTAASAEHAQAELEAFEATWGSQYPMIGRMWRRDWEHITQFLSLEFPPSPRGQHKPSFSPMIVDA